jgi:hypothetical protein
VNVDEGSTRAWARTGDLCRLGFELVTHIRDAVDSAGIGEADRAVLVAQELASSACRALLHTTWAEGNAKIAAGSVANLRARLW